MTAAEAARRIAAGELSSEALVSACLERIDAREGDVRAWAHLDREAALGAARAADAAPASGRGPLHGVPVGVKDIIDTADLPTECGTPVHAGRRPERDAACVAALRAAGAVVLGKTVTTELALYDPPVTRNPAAPDRTPGGSSSGSAAAVADGMVPLALGSQTAGSTIRPGAFCGVLGFKPTHGVLSLRGVKRLSERLDTLGLFASSVEDLRLLGSGLGASWPDGDPAGASFALCRTPWWDRADDDGRRAVERAADRLAAAGARVRELSLPATFDGLVEAQDTLQAHDCARSLAWELEHHRDALSEVLRAYLEHGVGVPADETSAAAALGAECRAELDAVLGDGEVLLVPAVVGEPPQLSERSTGDPLFCRPWTLLGVPALSVPGPVGPHGAPVGVQLVGIPGADAAVLDAGEVAAAALRAAH